MDYEVRLEFFEGPLDLLLHLIQKNEVDVFDIPVAVITDQYLDYLAWMETLNVEVAGEFLVMAATLMHIKSRMLLPREQEVEEDPVEEIRRPLLDYIQYKEAAGELMGRPLLSQDVFTRPAPEPEETTGEEGPPLEVTLFQLIDAFRRLMDRGLPEIRMELERETWSVAERCAGILARLREAGTLLFRHLFEEDATLSEKVVSFLALLELVHQGLVGVVQPMAGGEIRMVLRLREEEGEAHGDGS